MTAYRKKNILLINPWIYDFSAYDFWVKPLGLLYMAGLLRKNGYSVHLIDCLDTSHPQLKGIEGVKLPRRNPVGHGKFFKERIQKPRALKEIKRNYHRYGITPDILTKELMSCATPDLILVTSMMTYWYPGVFEVIRIAKQALPAVPIILGGVYTTLCPGHARLSGADMTLPGAGEKHLRTILHDIFSDEPSYEPDANDPDSLPYPAFDLLRLKDQFPILASRGCPHRCTYCASHLLAENFRQRNPIKIVDEIDFWHKTLGVNHFSIYDDAFLVNAQFMALPMLKEIVRRKVGCQFHCPNGLHASQVTEELSKLLRMAGFATIRFGFESSDPATQLHTGGKVDNEQFEAAVCYLREAGYEGQDIGVYLLCGLPGQESAEVRESIRYVQSRGARPILAEYSPIPGTLLWESAVNGSSFDLRGDPLFHNNSLLPCSSDKLTLEMYEDLKMMTRVR